MAETIIYYRKWDGRNGSHDYLKLAIRDYLESRGEVCPGILTVCRPGDGTGPTTKPYIRWEMDSVSNAESSGQEPALQQELPEVHFSISHSGAYWACAVSDAPVGLDLQEERPVKAEKLARRFFHPAEVEWLAARDWQQFCRIWAYKESWLKYTGEGMGAGLDGFSVVGAAEPCGPEGAWTWETDFFSGFWLVLTREAPCEVYLKELGD